MTAPFHILGLTFDTTPESTGGFFLGVNCNMESEGMLVTLCTLYIRGQMRGKNKQHCRVIIKIVLALQTLGPDATLRTLDLRRETQGPAPWEAHGLGHFPESVLGPGWPSELAGQGGSSGRRSSPHAGFILILNAHNGSWVV